jgi:hypothetical protein
VRILAHHFEREGAMSHILEGYDTEHDTAKGINKCPRVLQNWRQQGIGPPFIKVGKTVYYERASVIAWLKSQQTEPVRNRAHRASVRATA